MSDTEVSKTSWIVAGVAWVAAMVPHFFFTTPLDLHMQGDMKSWIAIAVWAPAMLAGAGFFDAGEFDDRFHREGRADMRNLALVGAPFVFMLLAAAQYRPLWTDMPRRPWDEIAIAMPLYAGLWALMTVYWQGLVQHRLLARLAPVVRVSILVLGAVAIAAPFMIHTGVVPALEGYLATMALQSLLAAVIFELGASVRVTMLVNAIFGATYIWFQQALFL